MDLEHNTFLRDRYRVLEKLGKGGMGAVYLAQDTVLQTNVAVKVNQNPRIEGREQFLHEARLLASLRHPNLPRVSDYFVIEDSQFLVMDYVPGDDLGTIVHKEGLQPIDKVLYWARQLGNALQYLHSQNPPVVHRDIKPANIKITPRGEVMLVDFGIAKSAEVSQETSTGARGLTPGYSPPEQYGSARTGPYSDQYSFAAMLYNLLTNQKPIDSVERLLGQKVLIPINEINPDVPLPTQTAIEKALSVRPEERYGSISEFVDALGATGAYLGDATQVRPGKPIQTTIPQAPNVESTRVAVGQTPSQPISRPPSQPPSQPPFQSPSQPPYLPPPPPMAYSAIPSQPISEPLPQAKSKKWMIPVGILILAAVLIGGVLLVMNIITKVQTPVSRTELPVVLNVTDTIVVQPTNTIAPTDTDIPVPTETETPIPSATPTEDLGPTATATPILEVLGRGGIVAYVSDETDGTFQVWTMKVYTDLDGNLIAGDKKQITYDPGNKDYPAWSPDGKRIVYSADSGDATNKYDLWTMDPDGKNQTNILTIPGNDTKAAWSPDGQWIVFQTDNRIDSVLQLMVVHPDGSGLKRISTDKQEFSPEWSPRMDKLVYVLSASNARYLWIRDPNNDFVDTEQTMDFGRLKYFDDPAWSPNGEWIAYTKVEGRTQDIFLNRTSSFGLEVKRLTNTTFDVYPAWSSDSEWILFNSNRDGNQEIYIMNISGTQQTNLTNSENASEMHAAWQIN
ncbi:MAG: protein kinase [Anaerolineaceae bacterium]|nr:protein kinase [Anaerolineaceae bacterium]